MRSADDESSGSGRGLRHRRRTWSSDRESGLASRTRVRKLSGEDVRPVVRRQVCSRHVRLYNRWRRQASSRSHRCRPNSFLCNGLSDGETESLASHLQTRRIRRRCLSSRGTRGGGRAHIPAGYRRAARRGHRPLRPDHRAALRVRLRGEPQRRGARARHCPLTRGTGERWRLAPVALRGLRCFRVGPLAAAGARGRRTPRALERGGPPRRLTARPEQSGRPQSRMDLDAPPGGGGRDLHGFGTPDHRRERDRKGAGRASCALARSSAAKERARRPGLHDDRTRAFRQ